MATDSLFHRFRWLVGGIREDAPATLEDGEEGVVRVNENRELLVALSSPISIGAAVGSESDDDPATEALLRIAGTADYSLDPIHDGDVAQLVTDLYRRLRVVPEGSVADAIGSDPSNPLKMGAVADADLGTVTDDDQVHLVTDLQRRLRVNAEGGGAHDAAATGNPVLAGAKATTVEVTVDNNDAAYLSLTAAASRLRVDGDTTKWGGTAVIDGGPSGSVGVGGTSGHDAAIDQNPVLAGAKATAAEPTAVIEGRGAFLSTNLAGRLRVDTTGNVADHAAAALNPVRVAGTADAALSLVDDGDVAQLVTDLYRRLYVIPEGPAADDVASTTINPIKVGGVAIALTTPDAAEANDMVHLTTDLYRRLRVIPEGYIADHAAVDTTNPLKMGAVADLALSVVDDGDIAQLVTDLYRRLRVTPEGQVADDAAVGTDNPLKCGAVADQVLAAVSDADAVHLTTDLYRQLRIVSAAYDSVAAADRISSNTIADDRDEAAQTWLSVTNDATDPDYGPSSAGYEVGNRTWLSFELTIADGTVTFEESELGTLWVDTTKSVINRATSEGGNTSFTVGDVAAQTFKLEIKCGARYVRAKWNPADATSSIVLSCTARVG